MLDGQGGPVGETGSALHLVEGGRHGALVFTDRLPVTLVHLHLHLHLHLPHAALAQLYGVDRSTVSGATREVRRPLAARGFAVPDRPGLRLRTLEDLVAYADAENVDLRLDGTEVQVRRPRAGHPGRRAFVSGKRKQNTIKTTTFSDARGRTLFSGVVRPGRMHDRPCWALPSRPGRPLDQHRRRGPAHRPARRCQQGERTARQGGSRGSAGCTAAGIGPASCGSARRPSRE
ncbi:transposase family protein [Kitasatospora sp. NPDC001683]